MQQSVCAAVTRFIYGVLRAGTCGSELIRLFPNRVVVSAKGGSRALLDGSLVAIRDSWLRKTVSISSSSSSLQRVGAPVTNSSDNCCLFPPHPPPAGDSCSPSPPHPPFLQRGSAAVTARGHPCVGPNGAQASGAGAAPHERQREHAAAPAGRGEARAWFFKNSDTTHLSPILLCVDGQLMLAPIRVHCRTRRQR